MTPKFCDNTAEHNSYSDTSMTYAILRFRLRWKTLTHSPCKIYVNIQDGSKSREILLCPQPK